MHRTWGHPRERIDERRARASPPVGRAMSVSDGELPDDALAHGPLARSLLHAASTLAPGSVLAVQGPWGRGKSDVLERARRGVQEVDLAPLHTQALLVNPWRHGTPDLLTPLVRELYQLAGGFRKGDRKGAWKAARSLLTGALSIGLKTTAAAFPGGGFLTALAQESRSVVSALFEAKDEEDETNAMPDADPVHAMGQRFRELVEITLRSVGARAGARLLVCVDDLDRCLPERQVAWLEALHFLVGAAAPVVVLVALDAEAAVKAIKTHYRSAQFDAERYLEKLFDLRVSLPPVPKDDVARVVRVYLSRPSASGSGSTPRDAAVRRLLGEAAPSLPKVCDATLTPAALRTPRFLNRLLDRMFLAAASEASGGALPISGDEQARVFVAWLAVMERWHAVRAGFQELRAVDPERAFAWICTRYSTGDEPKAQDVPSAYGELPPRKREPDLVELFRGLKLQDTRRHSQFVSSVDDRFRQAGL